MVRVFRAWLRHEGTAVVGLWGLLGAVALHDTAALHSPFALLAVTVLYLALSLCLIGLSLLLQRLGRVGGFAGGALLAGVLFWMVREHTDRIHIGAQPLAAVLWLAGFLGLAAGLMGLVRSRRPLKRDLAELFAVGLVLNSTITLLYHRSAELRWHLTQHHRLFATALHHGLRIHTPTIEEVFRDPALLRSVHPRPALDPSVLAREAGPGLRPHVILVVLDTLRADSLAAYGGDPELMPHLNGRAQRSAVFTDILANASWTSPSVAAFFTGLLPEESGFYEFGNRLAERNVTLAETFRALGYDTAAFVTNPAIDGDIGFDQGFDLYHEVQSGAAYARADRLRGAVMSWLAERPGDAPLFLYLHFMDPHTPYQSGGAPRAWQPQYYRSAYQRELRFLDAELDRLLTWMSVELPGPARVVVTADHGEEFGEHGGYGHGHALHLELLQIPLLVETERMQGERIDAPLEGRDLFQLVLELATSETPSLDRWADERARATRYASSYDTPSYWRGLTWLRPYVKRRLRRVEEASHALVWSGFGDATALYDLTDDRAETRNLAGRFEERARKLLGRLDASLGYATTPQTDVLDDELLARLEALGYAQ
jgi:arylsulfatase A-like enzyme